MEKLLLERLLARKELRLTAMQEKVEKQGIKLREAETRLALLEAIPGFFLYQWFGLLLLRLMVVVNKGIRVDHLLLRLCNLNRLVLSPLSWFFKQPKKISSMLKIDETRVEKDNKIMEPDEKAFPNDCSPAVRRGNPRNRGLAL